MAALPAVGGGRRSLAHGARVEWVAALKGTRGGWQAAYDRAPASRAEVAVRDLEAVLAA